MRSFFILLFAVFSTCVFAQHFSVEETKKAFRENGEKIRRFEKLNLTETVTINEKGFITVKSLDGISLSLASAGSYRLDSLYLLMKKFHDRKDSAAALMHTVFPDGLEYTDYMVSCFSGSLSSDELGESNYRAGYIVLRSALDSSYVNAIDANNVELIIQDPFKSGEMYFLCFKNAFGEFLDFKVVHGNTFSYNFIGCRGNINLYSSGMYMVVFSLEGRNSTRIRVPCEY